MTIDVKHIKDEATRQALYETSAFDQSLVYLRLTGVTATDTATIQAAIDAAPAGGRVIVFPQEQTGSVSSLTVSKDNITFMGGSLTLGVGLSAGDTAITVTSNNFRLTGMTLTAAARVYAVKMATSTVALSGLTCDHNIFTGFFYNCAAIGTSSFRISNFRAINNIATAPPAQNAGAFMARYTDDILYMGNKVYGAQNSSVYGAATSTRVTIIGNYATNIIDTVGGTEAGAQIENCAPDADSVISNNVFDDNDIWVSDSPNVHISNNIARRLRVSVTGVNADNIDRLTVTGGSYGAFWFEKFGSEPSTQRIHAKFSNIQLDPERYVLQGAPLTRAYHLTGGYMGKVTFDQITNVSQAADYAVSLSRDADMNLLFSDVDFGTQPHNLSGGTAGLMNERRTINPLVSTGNGYVYAYQGVNIGSPTIGGWTNFTYSVTVSNRNGEWVSNRFTPLVSGFYEFRCSIGVTPTAASNQIGLRLVTDPAGTPVEVTRLLDFRAVDTSSVALPSRSHIMYVTAGTVVGFQYFLTGASTAILGSAGLHTTASIRPV